MALIKCNECGHEVSDKASACPNCGCPIEKVPVCKECGQQIPDGVDACSNCGCPIEHVKTASQEVVDEPKKNKAWIWALAAALFCLICIGGYYFYSQSKGGNAENENSQESNISMIDDGDYCYQGEWESKSHAAQPCKVEFTKKNSTLLNCSYTNLKYDSRIPLTGTIKDGELHFVGNINGEQLVIDLKVDSEGNTLIGEGVDYAHSGDKAKLNLTKTDCSNVDYDSSHTDNQQNVEKRETDFSTSLGTLNIERVLNACYQQGVHNAGLYGNPNERIYTPEWRTEEKFKLFWTHNFGIPNNEKAQDVYRQGYERYVQGWDDTVNFQGY